MRVWKLPEIKPLVQGPTTDVSGAHIWMQWVGSDSEPRSQFWPSANNCSTLGITLGVTGCPCPVGNPRLLIVPLPPLPSSLLANGYKWSLQSKSGLVRTEGTAVFGRCGLSGVGTCILTVNWELYRKTRIGLRLRSRFWSIPSWWMRSPSFL